MIQNTFSFQLIPIFIFFFFLDYYILHQVYVFFSILILFVLFIDQTYYNNEVGAHNYGNQRRGLLTRRGDIKYIVATYF